MFKKNRYYSLQEIAGETYLLPYGQSLVERRHGFALGETGLYLWEKLDHCQNKTELIEYLTKEKGVRYDAAKDDVDNFIDQLVKYRVITYEKKTEKIPRMVLNIANITVGLYGDPVYFYRDELASFESRKERIDISFTVSESFPEFISSTVLIRAADLIVEENKECFILRYPKQKYINEIRFTRDGKEATAYVKETGNDTDRMLIGDVLHNALRIFFLYYARAKGYYAIESASIFYKDKAWLFSGPPRSGKTTHVELWKKLYGVECLNGEINLIVVEGKNAYVYGTPWCGASRTYTTKTCDLGGIIFLKKDEIDRVDELDQAAKEIMIAQRMISPCWNEKMLEENLEFASSLKNLVLVCLHRCTMNFTAVGVIKQRIDESKYEYQQPQYD
ncbi:MAG: PqqD family protein [Erysipelotrichaceae bacterium]|nr:PqqD family protein [Erysipelotrichaceae bacterium]